MERTIFRYPYIDIFSSILSRSDTSVFDFSCKYRNKKWVFHHNFKFLFSTELWYYNAFQSYSVCPFLYLFFIHPQPIDYSLTFNISFSLSAPQCHVDASPVTFHAEIFQKNVVFIYLNDLGLTLRVDGILTPLHVSVTFNPNLEKIRLISVTLGLPYQRPDSAKLALSAKFPRNYQHHKHLPHYPNPYVTPANNLYQ